MTTPECIGSGQSGVSRVLSKLDISIDAGMYYEAHQMYRTLYFRYNAQGKYEDCLALLYNGCCKLLSKQQDTCAVDLGLLIVDTLGKRGTNKDGSLWIERLASIIGRLSATTVERDNLIKRSVKWSGVMSGDDYGNPGMHKLIADIFWAEDNNAEARRHYLLCGDGHICGQILIEIHVKKGNVNEVDSFIVQAVLQQLCLRYRAVAEETFITYTTNHPQIKREEIPFKRPLLNFIYFLFRVIDNHEGHTFKKLCDKYKQALIRDVEYEKYLARISIIYFGITLPSFANSGLMGGMFETLFSQLFQGVEDSDVEQSDSEENEYENVFD